MTIRATLTIALLLGSATLPVFAQPIDAALALQVRKMTAIEARQPQVEAGLPRLKVTEEILPLRIPGHTLGEKPRASV